jgi:hypothetical protein
MWISNNRDNISLDLQQTLPFTFNAASTSHVQKDRSAIPSTRGVDNHHNIPRQNFDNWGANGGGGGGGGEDGTG